MSPKEKRDRLLKKDRPLIRPLQVYDGENYHKDIGILWVAYKGKPFEWLKEGLSQEQFASAIETLSENEPLSVAEDRNRHFKNKGVVALITSPSDGWKVEPHMQFMPWATKRNILRVVVSYLQYVRHSKNFGVCVVHSMENSKRLFDKVCEYGVLHWVGKVVNGDHRGDDHLYSVRGKRNVAIVRQE
jgi:hypothetical protein